MHKFLPSHCTSPQSTTCCSRGSPNSQEQICMRDWREVGKKSRGWSSAHDARISSLTLFFQVILTGDKSGANGPKRIFRSSDFAKNFIGTDLPFHPLTQIIYHPQNSDLLLALSFQVRNMLRSLKCQAAHFLKSVWCFLVQISN